MVESLRYLHYTQCMDESGERPQPQLDKPPHTLTRRKLFKTGAAAAAGAVASYAIGKSGVVEQIPGVAEPRFKEELLPPQFVDIADRPQVPEAEDWSAERLQMALEDAVAESIREKKHVQVVLPPGEIVITKKITCAIPKGASIALIGNKASHLVLSEQLSQIPTEWDSPGNNNLLEFADVDGRVVVDGVIFDGGSEKAGKGGYQPPGGPWDAVLLINGAGPGSGKEPEQRDVPRTGVGIVRNCAFYNTESAACYTKNLANAEVTDTYGKNFDALWCISWCSTFYGDNLKGQNSLSDGIAAYVCDEGELHNCQMKDTRQGFLLQGSGKASLEDCYAEGCAKGYDIYRFNESPYVSNCPDVTLTRCHSRGTAMAFAIDYATGHSVMRDSIHDDVGAWYEKSGFLHTGIVRPEELRDSRLPFWLGPNNSLDFTDVQIRKAPSTPHAYDVSFFKEVSERWKGIDLSGF